MAHVRAATDLPRLPSIAGAPRTITLNVDRAALWLGLAVVVLPLLISSSYYQAQFVVFGCYVIAVSGLNIVTGYAGQVSLGHAGLVAVGAYTTAILNGDYGVSFWVSVLLAAALTALVGLLLGFPALRVAGPYLALVTIAFNFLIEKLVLAGGKFTGAAAGKYGLEKPFVAASGDHGLGPPRPLRGPGAVRRSPHRCRWRRR